MKSNYKILGDYIKEVKVRNFDLSAKELLGINIDKFFMPSVANIVGTDLSTYRIVKKNQFACNRMHVGRDYRIPISLSRRDEPFMVSPAYDVFEIKDTTILNPEFLMMWFSRAEYDRNAWFYTDADVRGGLPWKSFIDMKFPLLSLPEQKALVAEYKSIQDRINLNQQFVQKLEETVQAIYREWFVTSIDSENLPSGWKTSSLGDLIEISSGKNITEKKDFKDFEFKFPVFGAGGIIGYSNKFLFNERLLSIGRVGTHGVVQRINVPCWPSDNTLIIKSLNFEYVYQLLLNVNYDEINRGGVQALITQTDIKNIQIVIPEKNVLDSFESTVSKIFYYQNKVKLEIELLEELKSLLLAKMANT